MKLFCRKTALKKRRVNIITTMLVAPGLTAIGLPPLVSHLFCYYWGGVSAITPCG